MDTTMGDVYTIFMNKGSAGMIAILIVLALIAIGIGVAAKNSTPGKTGTLNQDTNTEETSNFENVE